MSTLRLHDAPPDTADTAEGAIPDTYLFPGVAAPRRAPVRRIRPSIPADSTVHSVERTLDHAQDRLNNLRDLVDRFGLATRDEGPRAA